MKLQGDSSENKQ